MPKATLFVVSAPSGCGKTSIVRRLMGNSGRVPRLAYSVSYTTRQPRVGERDGVDYHFVSRAVFDEMVAAGAFAEWAEVYGQRYGTSARLIDEALRRGDDVLLDIDVQGAACVKKCFSSDAVCVFILPPSIRELRRRLSSRNTDGPEQVEKRLAAARREIGCAADYDYFIVNDDLDQAVESLEAVILAERLQRGRSITV